MSKFERIVSFFCDFTKSSPPKMTKSTSYNISSSLLMPSASKIFLSDKSTFDVRNKNWFYGKSKMTTNHGYFLPPPPLHRHPKSAWVSGYFDPRVTCGVMTLESLAGS